MAMFNLQDYETVEERLRRFWADPKNADARIISVNHTSDDDRQRGQWVIETRIYLSAEDQLNDIPKTTGWAFETDGTGGANKTSALENAETSSIGRALANFTYSGNKRASREEMEKVARNLVNRDWITEAAGLTDVDKLRVLWQDARQGGAPDDVLTVIKERADGFKDSGDSVGGNKATK
jgi:hypothetical protein